MYSGQRGSACNLWIETKNPTELSCQRKDIAREDFCWEGGGGDPSVKQWSKDCRDPDLHPSNNECLVLSPFKHKILNIGVQSKRMN